MAEVKTDTDQIACVSFKRSDELTPQDHFILSFLNSHSQIVTLNLVNPDGSRAEPHLTFNPCVNRLKICTQAELIKKLQMGKIRVTLDTLDKTGRKFKRIGPLGNMTPSEIMAASAESMESSILTFFPGARFDPQFSDQFLAGIRRMS